jgi:hypothetical protein
MKKPAFIRRLALAGSISSGSALLLALSLAGPAGAEPRPGYDPRYEKMPIPGDVAPLLAAADETAATAAQPATEKKTSSTSEAHRAGRSRARKLLPVKSFGGY